jgi:phosphoglycolate phosphatase
MKSKQIYCNVIFDLDGTLIDSSLGILSALSIAFDKCNIVPNIPIDSNLIGPPLDEMLNLLSGSNDQNILKELSDTFKECYDSSAYLKTQAFDGVEKMLKRLKEIDVTLYIATNKRNIPTQKIIKQLGWGELFDDIYALDSFYPAIEEKTLLINEIIKIHKLHRSDTLYVGDREEDGLAADKNNIKFLLTAWGYGTDVECNYILNERIAIDKPEDICLYTGGNEFDMNFIVEPIKK